MLCTPEIAADFVLEARELLEDLGGRLVALERAPEDREELNAVFRAFHTLKGGAGFLGATPLVELCHAAEETLGAVRANEAVLTSTHFDAAQQSLDWLQAMVDAIDAGTELPRAPASLIAGFALEGGAGSDMIDDADFEALLDQLHGNAAPGARAAAAPADAMIGDDEFEALLDQLHAGGVPGSTAPAATHDPNAPIDDADFEALLDQLHGDAAPGARTPAPVAAPAPAAPA
ncbi:MULTISPECIES: Hpt domain-containing protein, partial [Luteimonas]|uniref:Hpt domain-containing protein n=1 Tax=Luteimonas TaxID=83614 RepID=UPI0018EB4265